MLPAMAYWEMVSNKCTVLRQDFSAAVVIMLRGTSSMLLFRNKNLNGFQQDVVFVIRFGTLLKHIHDEFKCSVGSELQMTGQDDFEKHFAEF